MCPDSSQDNQAVLGVRGKSVSVAGIKQVPKSPLWLGMALSCLGKITLVERALVARGSRRRLSGPPASTTKLSL